MLEKEDVVLQYQVGTDHIVNFTKGDVTDEDLLRYLPAFNSYAEQAGVGKIIGFRLNGSKVTQDARRRFQYAVPDCEVEP